MFPYRCKHLTCIVDCSRTGEYIPMTGTVTAIGVFFSVLDLYERNDIYVLEMLRTLFES